VASYCRRLAFKKGSGASGVVSRKKERKVERKGGLRASVFTGERAKTTRGIMKREGGQVKRGGSSSRKIVEEEMYYEK